jgi:hypothetical protein
MKISRIKQLLIIFTFACICGLMLVVTGGITGREKLIFALKRYQVQQILGVALPETIDDLKYYKHQPDIAFRWYTAYIRFKASEEVYLQLMEQMEMTFIAKDTETIYRYYWPGQWKADPKLDLEWWNPKLETPKNAAAKDFGTEGWILATYEQGYVFITAFDPAYTLQQPTHTGQ